MSPTYIISRFAAIAQNCAEKADSKLLGIIPRWDAYLPLQTDNTGKCSVVRIDPGTNPDQYLLIGLAVVDALLVIIGILAFAYLLYGGFQYVVSQGEPDNTKKALETIKNALIGLVIAAVATQVVSYIGHSQRSN